MDLWEITQLLFPSQCLICAKPGVDLCLSCAPRPLPLQITIPDVRQLLLSNFLYDQSLTRILLAAKEDNLRVAQFLIAKACTTLLTRASRLLGTDSLIVVLVPSSPAAIAQRGYIHLERTLRFVPGMMNVKLAQPLSLRSRRGVLDQSLISIMGRTENVRGKYFVSGSRRRIAEVIARHERGAGIILMDDVVTSGSSMKESLRALNVVGIEPDMLISACISPRLASNRMVPS